jgi:hypothetical protein
MSRYIVRFWKTVMGDRGQESQICQASLELDARTKEQAAEIAKRTFCDAQRISDWLDHADRVDITEGDFPS